MYECLEKRRSVRRYRNQPVEEEKLQRIVSAMALAPSAHHSVPWHATVVTRAESKAALVEAMGEVWERDLEREGVAPAERSRLLERSRDRFTGAPALILMSLDTRVLPPDPRDRRYPYEEVMMTQSVAAATYAILLAAAYEGLGGAWHAAPLFCGEAVRLALGLPDYLRPQALVTLGYPEADPGPRPVRPLEGAVTWIREEAG